MYVIGILLFFNYFVVLVIIIIIIIIKLKYSLQISVTSKIMIMNNNSIHKFKLYIEVKSQIYNNSKTRLVLIFNLIINSRSCILKIGVFKTSLILINFKNDIKSHCDKLQINHLFIYQ